MLAKNPEIIQITGEKYSTKGRLRLHRGQASRLQKQRMPAEVFSRAFVGARLARDDETPRKPGDKALAGLRTGS
ncbi:hypothetical protein [Pseudomonas sp. FW305-25]|uniref:hypothetical protein n=1 Tax=Pseudomonas sp. FW305-25 TaxID=2070636 RepID=UPI001304F696|nr:hypothetical protein [Pseudomonas sp. FW305-25]